MAHVRKVTRTRQSDGSTRITWRASWTSPDGTRRSKTLPRKGDAEAYLREVLAGSQHGSSTMTLEQLAAAHYGWFDSLVRTGLREAVTRDGYGTAWQLHLSADPVAAGTRLCDLTSPKLQAFLDRLFERSGSTDVARKMRKTLVTWCKFGRRKGWMTSNPAEPCVVEATARQDESEDRFVIPSKDELSALLAAADSGDAGARDGAVIRLLMFGGLRISELLGLADDALALAGRAAEIRVRERLDSRYVVLGKPKSAKARRVIPIGPDASRAVKVWRLSRGPSHAFKHGDGRATGRLFPSPDRGPLWSYQDFLRDCWLPVLRRAGLLAMLPDAKGKNRPVPAFWPHALRHVAASLWIEQGLAPKKVQDLLGHSTLQLTMDLYGHLWRDSDADEALARASEVLIPTLKRT
jgi:integrase